MNLGGPREQRRGQEAFSSAEVDDLCRKLESVRREITRLEKELREHRAQATEIAETLSSLRAEGLHFRRTPYGSVRDNILKLLEEQPIGLPLAELSELLRERAGAGVHSRTPSNVLNRLKKEGIVERAGRRWKLADQPSPSGS